MISETIIGVIRDDGPYCLRSSAAVARGINMVNNANASPKRINFEVDEPWNSMESPFMSTEAVISTLAMILSKNPF